MASTQTITIPADVDLTGFAKPLEEGKPPMLSFSQFFADFCAPRLSTQGTEALKAARELNAELKDAEAGKEVPLTNAAHAALKASLPKLISELPQHQAHMAIDQRLWMRLLDFYDAVHAATSS